MTNRLRVTLLGCGAMNSPRYPPAGLLVQYRRRRLMLDGGPGAEPPPGPLFAWLVTDDRSELRRELRVLAVRHGTVPRVGRVTFSDLVVEPRPVAHTSHPTWGYLLHVPGAAVAWLPEAWEFPGWAAGVDLLFAEAAGWSRPIRFARGAGGHLCVLQVAELARQARVGRVVFSHIGRPSLRAIDAGLRPPFGEWGAPGRTYRLPG